MDDKSKPDPYQDWMHAQFKALTKTAADLQHEKFPDLHYNVPGLIPEGLTLFAGKPKIGKSWKCLDVALAVAMGGTCLGRQCEQGDVLALFLEDTDRRMQRRIDRMLGTFKAQWPAGLRYATKWPRMDEGGLDMLCQWAHEAEKPRLIIIDIWERVRPRQRNGGGTQYRDDYAGLSDAQSRLAEFPKLSTITTNHLRKMGSDDVFDMISGTLGLNGGADTLMVLGREEGLKTLEIRGRDVDDCSLIVEQDPVTLRWVDKGAKRRGAMTPERRKIVEAMRGQGPMTAQDIAGAIDGDYENVRKALQRMFNDDAVMKTARGSYVLTNDITSSVLDRPIQ
jgi:hypothetical protein